MRPFEIDTAEHRGEFLARLRSTKPGAASMSSSAPKPSLRIEDAINPACPWSGKPIREDSLTTYRGAVVGFCNPGCWDKFATAVAAFEAELAK
jgi:hypothetical protein